MADHGSSGHLEGAATVSAHDIHDLLPDVRIDGRLSDAQHSLFHD